jgi:chemotaxis protein MotA
MKSLAFDTLLGILLGFSLFFYAIFSSTTNWQMFIDLESFLMVAGGTLAATMIAFRSRYVVLSFKELIGTLIPQNINPETLYSEIENIINWARIAKQNGLRELEIHIRNSRTTDEFMRYGGNLLVTGYRGDENGMPNEANRAKNRRVEILIQRAEE